MNGCVAAGRAAAEVGARAEPDAPPSRRGWVAVFDSDAWPCALFVIGGWNGKCAELELAIVVDLHAPIGIWRGMNMDARPVFGL